MIRIIGGKWRGRKLKVLTAPSLRPTSDRVRETLFNWLMHDITGAKCLDLFAGTGALGFEALSRGAKSVTFVDHNAKAIDAIDAIIDSLAIDNTNVNAVCADAIHWLKNQILDYDIIFLDPPFNSPLLMKAIDYLQTQDLSQALIYIESATAPTIPAHWQTLKHKQTGEVIYQLVQGGKP